MERCHASTGRCYKTCTWKGPLNAQTHRTDGTSPPSERRPPRSRVPHTKFQHVGATQKTARESAHNGLLLHPLTVHGTYFRPDIDTVFLRTTVHHGAVTHPSTAEERCLADVSLVHRRSRSFVWARSQTFPLQRVVRSVAGEQWARRWDSKREDTSGSWWMS